MINNSVVRGAGTPNYSNATKEQSAMIFIANRYTRIYYSVIERAQSRILPKEIYKEKHHIVPRCMGGADDPENIASLTFKEHLFCHKLLVRMTEGPSRGKLSFAVLLMAREKSNNRIYATIKDNAREYAREYNKGKLPITNGKVTKFLFKDQIMPDGFSYGWSDDYLKKKKGNNKGKIYITDGINCRTLLPDESVPNEWYYGQADYHKKKISEALSGSGNPMYGKFGIDHPAYGNKLTDKTKKLMAETKLGPKNPMYGKLPHNAKSIEINGVVYSSMSEARLKTGLSRRTIENLAKSNLTTTADGVIL